MHGEWDSEQMASGTDIPGVSSSMKIICYEQHIDTVINSKIVTKYHVYEYKRRHKETRSSHIQSSNQEIRVSQPRPTGHFPFTDSMMHIFKDVITLKDIKKKSSVFKSEEIKVLVQDPMEYVVNTLQGKEEIIEKKYTEEHISPSVELSPLSMETIEVTISQMIEKATLQLKDEINKSIDKKLAPFQKLIESEIDLGKERLTTEDKELNLTANLTVAVENKNGKIMNNIGSNISQKISAHSVNTQIATQKDLMAQLELHGFPSEILLSMQELFFSTGLNYDRNFFLSGSKMLFHESSLNENNNTSSFVIDEKSRDINASFIEKSPQFLDFSENIFETPKLNTNDTKETVAEYPISQFEPSTSTVHFSQFKPELFSDLSKFIYIIFESLRRLNEENKINLSSKGSEATNQGSEKKPQGDLPIVNTYAPIEPEIKKINSIHSEDSFSPFPLKEMNEIPLLTRFPSKKMSSNVSCISLVSKLKDEVAQEAGILKDQAQLNETLDDLSSKKSENILDNIKPTITRGYLIKRKHKDILQPNIKILGEEEYLNLSRIQSNNKNKQWKGPMPKCIYKCKLKTKYFPKDGFSPKGNFLRNEKLESMEFLHFPRHSNEFTREKSFARNETKKSSRIKRSNVIKRSRSFISKMKISQSLMATSKMNIHRIGRISSRDFSIGSDILNFVPRTDKSRDSSEYSNDTSFCSLSDMKRSNMKDYIKKILKMNWKKHSEESLLTEHLTNIYTALYTDMVSEKVYKSVCIVSEKLKSSDEELKEAIIQNWISICHRRPLKGRKSNLERIAVLWSHFRDKICTLSKTNNDMRHCFFPALATSSEENRILKELVIQKYAREIIDYIADPKLCKLKQYNSMKHL